MVKTVEWGREPVSALEGGPEKSLRATALIQVPVCIFLVVFNIQ